MQKIRLFILTLILLISPMAFAQDSLAVEKPEITHVIMISIDGARPDAILQADTPVLQELAETGAVAWDAQTISPSVTIPAHTSMLTGLDTTEHRITHNNYTTVRIIPPSWITIAQEDGYQTAIVTGKEKFLQFHQDEDTYYEFVRNGDPGVIDKTIELLEEDYNVLFVHLPNTDFFGHLIGWMSDTYIYELGNTDANIGRLIDTLDELGIRETTLIIITADHGGHDLIHGTTLPEDMTVPLIVNGAGVEPETILEDADITQIASTILYALDLEPAEAMHDPLQLAFIPPDNDGSPQN